MLMLSQETSRCFADYDKEMTQKALYARRTKNFSCTLSVNNIISRTVSAVVAVAIHLLD